MHPPSAAPRRILALDAASCLGLAALCLFATAPLSGLLGLPPMLLRSAGLLLVAAGAFIALAASLQPVPGLLLRLVVAGNLLWVGASLAVLALVPMTAAGFVIVAGQALAVTVLTAIEARWIGHHPADVATGESVA